MRRWILTLLVATLGCKEAVLHDLSEKEAASMVFDLHQEGIEAKKARSASGWSVMVDAKLVPRATAVMTRGGLLRPEQPEELYQQKRFLLSRSERAHLLERSIGARIEETLESLPEVLDAKVNLYLAPQERVLLPGPQPKASASAVLIVSNRFTIPEDSLVRIIRGAAAIEESRVEVILVADERFSERFEATSMPPAQQSPGNSALLNLPNIRVEHLYIAAGICLIVAMLSFLAVLRSKRRRAFVERMRETSAELGSNGSHVSNRGIFESFNDQVELVQ